MTYDWDPMRPPKENLKKDKKEGAGQEPKVQMDPRQTARESGTAYFATCQNCPTGARTEKKIWYIDPTPGEFNLYDEKNIVLAILTNHEYCPLMKQMMEMAYIRTKEIALDGRNKEWPVLDPVRLVDYGGTPEALLSPTLIEGKLRTKCGMGIQVLKYDPNGKVEFKRKKYTPMDEFTWDGQTIISEARELYKKDHARLQQLESALAALVGYEKAKGAMQVFDDFLGRTGRRPIVTAAANSEDVQNPGETLDDKVQDPEVPSATETKPGDRTIPAAKEPEHPDK